MAQFFEVQHLVIEKESGKPVLKYIYLNIDQLMYWKYIPNSYQYGDVFSYQLTDGNFLFVTKQFHVEFKKVLTKYGHKIIYHNDF